MKSSANHSIATFAAMLLVVMLFPLLTIGQQEGSGNVQKNERQIPQFDKIIVGSAFTVILKKGETSVVVESDDNLQQEIETLVTNGVLQIDSKGIRNPTSLNVYVSSPNISSIELTGAARLKSEGVLDYPSLKISGNGASRANIEIRCNNLVTEAIGATRITYRGEAIEHTATIGGASAINALMLKTEKTTAEVSGAGRISVFAKSLLNTNITGAGLVTYFDNPDVKSLRKTGNSTINLNNPEDAMPKHSTEDIDSNIEVRVFDDGDTVLVKLGNLDIKVDDANDYTKIGIGNHDLEIDDDGNVKLKKKEKVRKFDGHWGGFDLGINGLLDADNSLNVVKGYEYLDLKMEKSINVAINVYEQNFNIIGNKFGMTTGLGLEWNNYRFQNRAIIETLDDSLTGYIATDNDRSYLKSKLVTSYLTLPVMFEFQTNSKSKANSFHVGVGVLSGLRIGTHTKLKTENGRGDSDKQFGSTAMNPFKLDLMARLGWGKLNLYGKYSLISLFKENRGPELYPFSVGLSLVSW